MESVFSIIKKEENRQGKQIELIASENFASKQVRAAQGSVLTNKYAEGYPGRRYYCGCKYVDEVENLAIDYLKKIYGCEYANVQPHSGSNANIAVYFALLNPGDTILGMSLSSGGHLTHGHKVSISGKWFKAVHYGVDPQTHLINYDEVEELAIQNKPKIIIAGGSAYPRLIDFQRFREIADLVGAYLMVDMAHFSGLVASQIFPSPLPFADVVTSTTHKTLRGPRGGIIMTNNIDLAKKIDNAVMPGIQGGPLMHVIAAKAVAFYEAQQESFKEYSSQVVKNAVILGQTLEAKGFKLITGGTDTHLLLIDLSPFGCDGKEFCEALESVNITANSNMIPFDTRSAMRPSGIRLGTPAMTTRGFKEKQFVEVGLMIADVMLAIKSGQDFEHIKQKALNLCDFFPLP